MSTRRPPVDADIASRARATVKPGVYTLLPQANRVPSVLPNFSGASAQVLAAPQLGARFVEHELLIRPGGGSLGPICDGFEHFLFVLEGGVTLRMEAAEHQLCEGGYSWLPPERAYELKNQTDSQTRVIWLRRRYASAEGLQVPDAIVSNERDIPAVPEDTYLEQHLIPYENPAFDLAFNLLNFEPGTCFGYVESHIMEHGLYMLAGRGIYWLNGDYHEVQANDFIFMAAYCPQYFYATGWDRARYLLYKDVNRDYTQGL